MPNFMGRELLAKATEGMRTALSGGSRPYMHRIARTPGVITRDMGFLSPQDAVGTVEPVLSGRALVHPGAANTGVMSHEAFHQLRGLGGLSQDDLRAIIRPSTPEASQISNLTADPYYARAGSLPEEALAYTMSDPNATGVNAAADILQGRGRTEIAARMRKLRDYTVQRGQQGNLDVTLDKRWFGR